MPRITFIDTEVQAKTGNILDIGATNDQNGVFHSNALDEFKSFIASSPFICGHNIIDHDKVCLEKWMGPEKLSDFQFIDTLFLSALLFPEKPYHRLVKDDKLDPENLNNPYTDATKAKDLFYDEVEKFRQTDPLLQQIYLKLLGDSVYFKSFFAFVQPGASVESAEQLIRNYFLGQCCENKALATYINEDPVALAYTLALITCNSRESITPPWILHRFPDVERYLFQLRSDPCLPGCTYCNQSFDAVKGLNEFFGFPSFREFDGVPLQEQAVGAALHNKSILAVFPTGGGKSLTYQVPALMAGKNSHALTVIISPLQSLMKDQVDNLLKKDITDAVTINGLLDPIERGKSIERVREGMASILYISPESLRSKTIEHLLLGRKIARFVIDEAHCFSSWGHDFRVDYLYIGDFLKALQEKKNLPEPIPVSCFTATAKPQVIDDIQHYFREKLQLDLELFLTASTRKNLQYQVIHCAGEQEKYNRLRDLVDGKRCPTIVYVSRVRKAMDIAKKLTDDGYQALPYHGKMESRQKTLNQNAFMEGEVDIMVATSAFGMGVDKDNVGMVVHYDISDSLENYVQEAGRAGRDERIRADCYVLFNEDDLGKHFILLNQTKIDLHEIGDIWKAVKTMTRERDSISNSALEIARKAGWNDQIEQLETRVTTAIAALEEAGYLKRIHNSPRIYATGILAKNAEEAIEKINSSSRMNEKQKELAIRIIKKLIASRSRQQGSDEVAESRVDYISDHLGIRQQEVIHTIGLLREEGILADTMDLTVSFTSEQNPYRSRKQLENFARLEKVLTEHITSHEQVVHIKKLNEEAIAAGVDSNPNRIRTILNFWAIKHWITKENRTGSKDHYKVRFTGDRDLFVEKTGRRHALAGFVIRYLFEKIPSQEVVAEDAKATYVEFSIHELREAFNKEEGLFTSGITMYDVEDTLFFLTRIEALTIEGGFLVVYNRLNIQRKEQNLRKQYKIEDYESLKTHYEHKTQQIHIVGEYARKMLQDYQSALKFVDDYFTLNYSSFLQKY
ncbi:MAG: RecQ family ATP-dependent DNA helicase, partial [Bacteroidales bacterium]|nr:RecQ family ATP-dependent DNA helicase [Bacteroidales bacterium]